MIRKKPPVKVLGPINPTPYELQEILKPRK